MSDLHINEIVEDYMPRKQILPLLPQLAHEPGMSEFESAFLCGVINRVRPNKIVEIGVAGGTSTAIILQCMENLNTFNYDMYSIDVSDTVWHTVGLKTGTNAEYAKKILNISKHKLFIGGTIASFIKEIGNDIDFVILDTVHRIPGEILDFLVLLPYLKDGATVIVHDLMTCQYARLSAPQTFDYYATNILFQSLKGEKYINFDGYNKMLPNIGAIRINQETRGAILETIFSLTLPWGYMPEEKELKKYSECIRYSYDELGYEIYRQVVEINKNNITFLDIMMNKLINKKILIWGAGKRGKMLWKLLSDNNQSMCMFCYCDKNASVLDGIEGCVIKAPEDINWEEYYDYYVITPASQDAKRDIKKYLLNKGINRDRILLF